MRSFIVHIVLSRLLSSAGEELCMAVDIELATDAVACTLSTEGGVVWRLEAMDRGRRVALLRRPPDGAARPPNEAGSFPMVPFGNRVAGNSFIVDGRSYYLQPNVAWDPHYLHGDGWLAGWSVEASSTRSATLLYDHVAGSASPYCYRAYQ